MDMGGWSTFDLLATLFVVSQLLYLCTFLVEAYFFTRPVNMVEMPNSRTTKPVSYPYIILFYPVLDELEETMRTTMSALSRLDYPTDRFEVVAIPNNTDTKTIASLRRLRTEFSFLDIIEVPPTSDPSWDVVWSSWDDCRKAYWWHEGERAGLRDLPPKKTRQLVYAFYQAVAKRGDADFVINYIDADSAPPTDHFLAAAYGLEHFDVLQAQNIAGNLTSSMPASFHAFDHMAWDGHKYRHLTADGRHPYWVLGKGLFFKAVDLVELGGFHPWITIEDPEVGLRMWKNGRRLGVIENPLIEEVPETFAIGIKQRKRWVAGFWQTLGSPLQSMGFTRWEKFKARLNFLPCLSLSVNVVGLPLGIWALANLFVGTRQLPTWTLALAAVNGIGYIWVMGALYLSTWRRTALVLPTRRQRIGYLLRVNPLFVWVWWLIWLVPLWIGWRMYVRDGGLVWERTDKVDANARLVRERPLDATIAPRVAELRR